MNSFVQRHRDSVIGALSGLDRVLFRGTLRRLATAGGLFGYLWSVQVLLKDFGDWSMNLTEQIKQASLRAAERLGRPVQYLADPSVRKEDLARQIAERDGIRSGLVCVLSAVEPCWSYDVYRNRQSKKLELVSRQRKCLHLYHYRIHPELGLMHARLQTWLPFNLRVCINGREWLARQMDRAGIAYARKENCFTSVSDVRRAQALLDEQLTRDWTGMLESIRRMVNPAHEKALGSEAPEYYWSVDQSEWATDVMFRNPRLLAELYPRLIRHGITTLASRDVMRFLGRKVPVTHGAVNRNFAGEVVSDLKERPEGMRLKHRVNQNSVKMYDKQASVLRVETTINDPRDFKVYRTTESKPHGRPKWRKLRKGVADLHRRAQVSQASNQRYLEALAAVEQTDRTLGQIVQPLCRPTTYHGRRARALRPFEAEEMKLLETLGGGQFALNGFRNRDLRALLHPAEAKDPIEARRRSAAVTRKLRLLRAHGLIRKVPRTHRYLLSAKGRDAITALLAAREADTAMLAKAA